jgi:hypothetical protein
MSIILGLLSVALFLAVYFLPAIVAELGKHKNKQAILVLNLLTGWTFIGWIVALVWAYVK